MRLAQQIKKLKSPDMLIGFGFSEKAAKKEFSRLERLGTDLEKFQCKNPPDESVAIALAGAIEEVRT